MCRYAPRPAARSADCALRELSCRLLVVPTAFARAHCGHLPLCPQRRRPGRRGRCHARPTPGRTARLPPGAGARLPHRASARCPLGVRVHPAGSRAGPLGAARIAVTRPARCLCARRRNDPRRPPLHHRNAVAGLLPPFSQPDRPPAFAPVRRTRQRSAGPKRRHLHRAATH